MVLESANLALRFLLELCALAALGYWGFQTGKGPIVKFGLGIGAPLLAAVVWGMYGAPGSQAAVTGVMRVGLELAIFGVAAVALYAAGQPGLASVFGVAVMINRALMYVWGQ